MVLLYSTVMVVLGTLKLLTNRRASSLERKYYAMVREADRLLTGLSLRGGLDSRKDACLAAKQQYQLGQLIQKRDRLESKHGLWQHRSAKLGRWLQAIRTWKGKKLPYTMGAVDISLVLYLLDQMGANTFISVRHLVQTVTALVTR